jgi:hypothetical protein
LLAVDRDFLVVFSKRAAKQLHWHVINKSRSGLTIAAYSPDIDNVMLLRLPNTIGDDLNLDLKLGARLVTCNTYGTLPSLLSVCDLLFETQGLFETQSHRVTEIQRYRDTEGLNR